MSRLSGSTVAVCDPVKSELAREKNMEGVCDEARGGTSLVSGRDTQGTSLSVTVLQEADRQMFRHTITYCALPWANLNRKVRHIT